MEKLGRALVVPCYGSESRASRAHLAKEEVHPIIKLQRMAGNAAVSDLFVQRQFADMKTVHLNMPETFTILMNNGQVTDVGGSIGS